MTQLKPPGARFSGLSMIAGRAVRDPMVRNSLAIMASTVATSLLGYAFWMIVAHRFDSAVSGTAAATTSAIQATVTVASIGAAAALVEWLPRCTTALEWRARVTAGMFVAGVTALAGALAVVGVLGIAFTTLPQLAQPGGAALFCLACVFIAVGLVVDYVAVSEHRGGLLLIRNLTMCGARVPLIFLPAAIMTGADLILLAWTVAAGLSLVWAAATFGTRSGRSLRPHFGHLRSHLREMAGSLVGQHVITVTAMLAGYVLPVVVYSRLSATDNAYFYITWMLGSVFFIISPAVSAALFVEGAADSADMRPLVKRCLLIVGALLAVPIVVYLAGGRIILGLFGDDYVTHGFSLLVLLTLSAIPDAITNIAVAVLRVTGRITTALTLNTAMLVGTIVGTWIVLPHIGILGAGLCWLVSQCLGAAWAIASWRRIVDGGGPVRRAAADAAAADVLPAAVESADH